MKVSPLNPIKEDWVEETEEDEEEEEETGTFILGGETYSYDVTTIQIYGIFLPDISELENCKKLETLDLDFFNPCSDGVTYEQVFEYKERHPGCICYYDYYRL